MRGEIVEGDFPKGAILASAGLFGRDVVISWFDGLMPKREYLKGKIDRIELLERSSQPNDFPADSLTPLEGGIIGGSVAGYNGFLAGYLSLPDSREAVLFGCYLSDGRYFTAVSDIEMYNLTVSI